MRPKTSVRWSVITPSSPPQLSQCLCSTRSKSHLFLIPTVVLLSCYMHAVQCLYYWSLLRDGVIEDGVFDQQHEQSTNRDKESVYIRKKRWLFMPRYRCLPCQIGACMCACSRRARTFVMCVCVCVYKHLTDELCCVQRAESCSKDLCRCWANFSSSRGLETQRDEKKKKKKQEVRCQCPKNITRP